MTGRHALAVSSGGNDTIPAARAPAARDRINYTSICCALSESNSRSCTISTLPQIADNAANESVANRPAVLRASARWPPAADLRVELDRPGAAGEPHQLPHASLCLWRAQYGGMNVNEARRLRELEAENGKPKKLLAEAHLDTVRHRRPNRETETAVPRQGRRISSLSTQPSPSLVVTR